MVVSVIQSQISTADLNLRPGYSAATLDVEVVNNSDRQASFHIVLAATGADEQETRRWYQITPMTSSKVPPGTRSHYTVNIIDTPLPDFVGLANVTVRIISPELQSEDRHILRLRVEPGIDRVPFKVELNTKSVQDYPGQIVEIGARIHNTSRHTLSVMLSCPGIEAWITQSSPTSLRLRPNRWHNILMVCQIPADLSLCHSQDYPFQILAVDADGHAAAANGTLEVLPMGYFELTAERTDLTIPDTRRWLPDRHTTTTQVEFQLNNQSNLKETLQIRPLAPPGDVARPDKPGRVSASQVTLTPDTVPLEPGQTRSVEANIQVTRPLSGWVRTSLIEIQARSENSFLELRNDTETLQVKVFPIIPRWLQAIAILLLAGGIASLWLFQTYRQHHRQLVSSVQFNGTGSRVISGSSDQTIRQWQVNGRRLRPTGDIIRLDKAVRVLQYRPVDNNQLAAGLENGEIQLWDLLKPPTQEPLTLINPAGQQQGDRDDRVMALAPTTNARYLFSGYGSGQVTQWYIDPDSANRAVDPLQPIRQLFIPELAIYDVAVVDPEDQTLAVAGRYNKLLLWRWPQTDAQNAERVTLSDVQEPSTDRDSSALIPVDYPAGGQDDYITSLATVEQQPYRLATADNQGRITIWDLETCLNDTEPCAVLDQWQPDPDTAIRSIALTADGCYLASASDSGQLTLWPLTRQGRRLTKYLQGESVRQVNTRLNSVDIKALETDLLIVSGADDRRVRLNRVKHLQRICQ
ncbi:MAG: hypothetical protein AAF215_17440 [Cyanobacteria bacterium P01_A01_bin.123]